MYLLEEVINRISDETLKLHDTSLYRGYTVADLLNDLRDALDEIEGYELEMAA